MIHTNKLMDANRADERGDDVAEERPPAVRGGPNRGWSEEPLEAIPQIERLTPARAECGKVV